MKVVIEIKDVEKTLTMDEAEKLWNELNRLFKVEPRVIEREVIRDRFRHPYYYGAYNTTSTNLSSGLNSIAASIKE